MGNDDSFGSSIQGSKNLTRLVASNADNGGHAKAFTGPYVMLPLESISGAVLAIDKPKIEASSCAHFRQRGSRWLDYKSVQGLAVEKPPTQRICAIFLFHT
jgi:hypothetical protein